MIARALIFLIRLYQRTLSRMLGRVCRFEPSCSQYAMVCLSAHGSLKGGLLSLRRICKCHPFHPGGYDPPPARNDIAGDDPSPPETRDTVAHLAAVASHVGK